MLWLSIVVRHPDDRRADQREREGVAADVRIIIEPVTTEPAALDSAEHVDLAEDLDLTDGKLAAASPGSSAP